jgi:hypothetical protein
VPDREWRIEVDISGIDEPIVEPSPS